MRGTFPVQAVVYLCFALLVAPGGAGQSEWQHYQNKFLSFTAPSNTKIINMPDLIVPTKAEGKRFANFVLEENFRGEKVDVFVTAILPGSIMLENKSPIEMQTLSRAAIVNGEPVLSSRKFVLRNSHLQAELIEQTRNKRHVWVILASNSQVGLTIGWSSKKASLSQEVLQIANSIRLVSAAPMVTERK